MRRNQPHPTCAIPAALRRGQTLTILSSPRVVDVALSSRIDQARVIASDRHAGLYDNRARRQSQFLDGSDRAAEVPAAPELTPQKGPTPTGCENRSASPRKPSWRSDVVHDQMATLSCAATDLAGRTGGTFAKPPKGRLLSMGLLDCYVAKLVSFSGALGTAFSTDWSEVGTPARHFPRRIVSIAPQKRRTQSHASSKRYSRCERIMSRYPLGGQRHESEHVTMLFI